MHIYILWKDMELMCGFLIPFNEEIKSWIIN